MQEGYAILKKYVFVLKYMKLAPLDNEAARLTGALK